MPFGLAKDPRTREDIPVIKVEHVTLNKECNSQACESENHEEPQEDKLLFRSKDIPKEVSEGKSEDGNSEDIQLYSDP